MLKPIAAPKATRIHNIRPDDVYCFGEKCSQILPPLDKYHLLSASIFSLVCFTITTSLYCVLFYGIKKQAIHIASVRSSASSLGPTTPAANGKPNAKPDVPKTPEIRPEGWRDGLENVPVFPDDDDVFRFDDVMKNNDINKKIPMQRLDIPSVTSQPVTSLKVTSPPTRSPRLRHTPRYRSSVTRSVFGAIRKVSRVGRQRSKVARRRDVKVMRTMFVIMAVFVVTTAPLMLFILYTTKHNDRSLKEIFNYLLQVTTLNSLLNPFLYFLRVPAMRGKLKKLLRALRWDNCPLRIRKNPKPASKIRNKSASSESGNSSSF
uniref:uncharacterized protein LOC113474820 n=1 Tax=Ciona intestinalis TaxID=7719 RepID=UPI000EF4CF0C|nr:uncharacterized protein LOC113474820 [Ciona intestinalis]|eukprot:XP_026693139.1 uncharacterized protein LOC113474820 [Ciona intestinalis]